VIGVFEGTGIGPEVIEAALRVLSAVAATLELSFEVRKGGSIGEAAEREFGRALSAGAVAFCRSVFEDGGAILSGPGGGRYVYDLRREFDLFCKFVPVRPFPELNDAGCLRARHVESVDLLIVRDNTGGVYQGRWQNRGVNGGRVAEHAFHYSESQVRRIVEVAARAAAARRGQLQVVVKDAGVPGISALWTEVSREVAARHSIDWAAINVDLAAYQLIRHPGLFDVIVAPNLIGDILADIAGVLVASRGITFSGNFTAQSQAVYQTNHGCAHDLAGSDTANPGGQLLSLAMLLRESFGLDPAATLIERALARAWKAGQRTADLARPGDPVIGTRAMTDRVIEQIHRLAASSVIA
jgi:3-isopropylmalate dehydrogenase